MAEGGGGRRWLAYGCFGCLGVLLVVVLAAAALFFAARQSVRSEDVAESTITPQIPHADSRPSTATGEAAEPTTVPVGVRGKVVLKLSNGGFKVRPAERGSPMRIEATYDRRSYEMHENLVESDSGWVYEVDFRLTASQMMATLKQLMGGTSPELNVFLPLDVPIALELDVSSGGAEVELGGLWLTTADVEFGKGGFQLKVDEPLREPMDRLRIHGSMGGFKADGLGNASPRELDVDFRMGGMSLDLRGAWAQDADVSIAFGMGGGAVTLPRDVRVVGIDDPRFAATEDPELPAPTLTFSISGDLENLEFID